MAKPIAGDSCTSLEPLFIKSEDPGGKRRNICYPRAKATAVEEGF
jgi:hypothetical protein